MQCHKNIKCCKTDVIKLIQLGVQYYKMKHVQMIKMFKCAQFTLKSLMFF